MGHYLSSLCVGLLDGDAWDGDGDVNGDGDVWDGDGWDECVWSEPLGWRY